MHEQLDGHPPERDGLSVWCGIAFEDDDDPRVVHRALSAHLLLGPDQAVPSSSTVLLMRRCLVASVLASSMDKT